MFSEPVSMREVLSGVDQLFVVGRGEFFTPHLAFQGADDQVGVLEFSLGGVSVQWLPVDEDDSLESVVRRGVHGVTVVEALKIWPGGYTPRVWRTEPSLGFPQGEWGPMSRSGRSFKLLAAEAERVFGTIEPVEANHSAFGQAIRHLLLLACTEVEAGLKVVDRLHGDGTGGGICRLAGSVEPLLRLSEWELRLLDYPAEKSFRPFERWADSTESPTWWKAYNSLKHEAGDKMECASLENLLGALGGVLVLHLAQFGALDRSPFFASAPPLFEVVNCPVIPLGDRCFPMDGEWLTAKSLRPPHGS